MSDIVLATVGTVAMILLSLLLHEIVLTLHEIKNALLLVHAALRGENHE
jgi:hypothetical protein